MPDRHGIKMDREGEIKKNEIKPEHNKLNTLENGNLGHACGLNIAQNQFFP